MSTDPDTPSFVCNSPLPATSIHMRDSSDSPDGLPLIDVSAMRSADRAARINLGRQIVAAFEQIGAIRVVNHGVDRTLTDGVFSAARRFFSQSPDTLASLGTNRWNRGFLALRTNSKPGYAPDVREAFDIGIDIPADDPRVQAGKPLHAPNHWPENDPEFRKSVETYFDEIRDFGSVFQKILADGLEIPENSFELFYKNPLSTLRLLHYPNPQGISAPNEFAMAPHNDFGAYTFLLQDGIGGLEYQEPDGNWHAVKPVDGSLLVFLGDLMTWWSCGRFKALRHRVVSVPGQARYSIPVFYNPNIDADLVWPGQIQGAQTEKYSPVTCGSYILAQAQARASQLGD